MVNCSTIFFPWGVRKGIVDPVDTVIVNAIIKCQNDNIAGRVHINDLIDCLRDKDFTKEKIENRMLKFYNSGLIDKEIADDTTYYGYYGNSFNNRSY